MSRVMYVKASNALAGTNEAFVNVEFLFVHPFPIGTEFRIGRVSWKTIGIQNSITRRNEVSHTSLRAAPLFFLVGERWFGMMGRWEHDLHSQWVGYVVMVVDPPLSKVDMPTRWAPSPVMKCGYHP